MQWWQFVRPATYEPLRILRGRYVHLRVQNARLLVVEVVGVPASGQVSAI